VQRSYSPTLCILISVWYRKELIKYIQEIKFIEENRFSFPLDEKNNTETAQRILWFVLGSPPWGAAQLLPYALHTDLCLVSKRVD
jgi:hypothetical protein